LVHQLNTTGHSVCLANCHHVACLNLGKFGGIVLSLNRTKVAFHTDLHSSLSEKPSQSQMGMFRVIFSGLYSV